MAAAERHLHLVVPDLLAGRGGDHSARALKTLLARATQDVYAGNAETLLCTLFGVALPDGAQVPVAPLTYALDTDTSPTGWWLRADPVYLRTGNDRLFLMGNDVLDITQAEADTFAQALRPLFTELGAELITPAPKRWYLRLTDDPHVAWPPPRDILGLDIHHCLTGSQHNEHAKRWRRVLNEAQMLLHAHALNDARTARGELPINSVWFWGGGQLPARPAPRYTQVWSDDALASSLARLSATPRAPVPADAADWLTRAAPGAHLIYLEHLAEAMPTEAAALAAFDTRWAAPLLGALKTRALTGLHLYAAHGAVFHGTPRGMARWWRRARNLSAYQPLADAPRAELHP